jgi:asparagine synthase (glutamine-hydrolysing)
MLEFMPAGVTKAEKQGFSAPDASWFKGDSIDFVKRTLMNGHARIYDLLDKDAVQALVGEHLSGEHNRRLLIWSLLNVEEWLSSDADRLPGRAEVR